VAVSLMKIANDVRWLSSGPRCAVGEIYLPEIQPGSSIMPAKVNPVICESVMMACAHVMGNDTTVMVCGQHGNFELNVMLPVVAHNVLESVRLLANASRNLADMSVSKIKVNTANVTDKLEKNPILVTALNPLIGYDLAAKIAKKAYAESRSLKDVAREMTDLSDEELNKALDPIQMTKGGFTD
jgi:fumarate hydratase class II